MTDDPRLGGCMFFHTAGHRDDLRKRPSMFGYVRHMVPQIVRRAFLRLQEGRM